MVTSKKYTRWAVKLFQKKHKLKQDGIVGPKTKAKFKSKAGATTSKNLEILYNNYQDPNKVIIL
ncbi:peptidoglycan-binding domain-containing protein [Methanobrevibacter arboriphilus]|uniref:peptidoglycan-binding domain-containing protein n=1 Tax=Methanobrevibacter arboriphilus TaxID=39441 RepID=UPI000A84460F|nr:peptidoglycan-binding domain-containing protein [Methanobrevibacter arboriphilus]